MPIDLNEDESLKPLIVSIAMTIWITVALILYGCAHPHIFRVMGSIFAIFAFLLPWGMNRVRVSSIGLVLLASLLYLLPMAHSLLVSIPLPQSLFEWLRPAHAHDRALLFKPLFDANIREQGVVIPTQLSAAAPESLVNAARLGVGLVAMLVGYTLNYSQQSKRFLRSAIPAIGIVLVSLSAYYGLRDDRMILGIFQHNGHTPFMGPLLNPNHQAKVVGLIGLWSLARIFDTLTRGEKILAAMSFLACSTNVLLTLSRWGIVVYGVFVLAFALSLVLERKDLSASLQRHMGLIVMFALLTLSATVVLFGERVGAELSTLFGEGSDLTKLDLFPPALALARDHWFWGVGSGSFADLYPPYAMKVGHSQLSFLHAENMLIQSLVDYGFPLSLMFLAIGFLLIRKTTQGETLSKNLPNILLIAFPFVADMLDFSLEHAGAFALASLIWGLSFADALQKQHQRKSKKRKRARQNESAASRKEHKGRLQNLNILRPKVLFRSAMVFTALLVPFALWASYDATTWEIDRTYKIAPGIEPVLEGLLGHPHDAHRYYQLGYRLRIEGSPGKALGFLNSSLALWQNHGASHLEIARSLYDLKRYPQSCLEYRSAFMSKGLLEHTLLKEILARFPEWKFRSDCTIRDSVKMQSAICTQEWQAGRQREAVSCAHYLSQVMGEANRRHFEEMEWEYALRSRDLETLSTFARTHDTPSNPKAWVRLADTLTLLKSPVDAYEIMKGKTEVSPNTPKVLTWRLQNARLRKDFPEALEVLHRLRRAPTSNRKRRDFDVEEAALYETMGRISEAYRLWTRLSQSNPKSTPIWQGKLRCEHLLNFSSAAASTRQHMIDAGLEIPNL